jgi:sugar O-acyltransferase (sialic acid O-acetyltransferase NeuD family)
MYLFIIGNGGHAKVIREAALLRGFECVNIVQENPAHGGEIGEDEFFRERAGREFGLICGVGSAGSLSLRKRILEKYAQFQDRFLTIVHPAASVSREADLGLGVFVGQGAQVAIGAKVGDNVILNTGSIVDHDSVVKSNSHVAPGAVLSGNVELGHSVHIGAGATVIQGIRIASDTVVGAGAVVVKNILTPNSTWVGIPARQLSELTPS